MTVSGLECRQYWPKTVLDISLMPVIVDNLWCFAACENVRVGNLSG